MGALLVPLLSLFSSLPGQIGDYFKTKQEIEKIKLDTQKELQLANQKLAGEIAQSEFEKSKVVIKATGAWFKYFTFFMWFGPFMIGIFLPSAAKDIFDNLSALPQWYVESCIVIMFTVWGISVSAPVVSNIFNGLGGFFESRREYKLEKAKIDRKAYYDALRKLKGVVTDDDVRIQEAIFDELDKS